MGEGDKEQQGEHGEDPNKTDYRLESRRSSTMKRDGHQQYQPIGGMCITTNWQDISTQNTFVKVVLYLDSVVVNWINALKTKPDAN